MVAGESCILRTAETATTSTTTSTEMQKYLSKVKNKFTRKTRHGRGRHLRNGINAIITQLVAEEIQGQLFHLIFNSKLDRDGFDLKNSLTKNGKFVSVVFLPIVHKMFGCAF